MKNFYSIYDKISERYNLVIEQQDDAQALRTLAMECKNPQSFIRNFIDDYDLYKIATYDETTGKFTNLDIPKLICHASRFKKEEEK